MKKTRKSRLLSLFLAVIMVVGVLPLSAITASAAMPDYEGDGTKGAPYLVYTYEGLRECLTKEPVSTLNSDGSTYIKLMDDVSCPHDKNEYYLEVKARYGVKLDLNHHAIQYNKADNSDRLFSVEESLEIHGPGLINFHVANENAWMFYSEHGAIVRLDGGTYESWSNGISLPAQRGNAYIVNGAKFMAEGYIIFGGNWIDIGSGELHQTSKDSNRAVIQLLNLDYASSFRMNDETVIRRESYGELINSFVFEGSGLDGIYLDKLFQYHANNENRVPYIDGVPKTTWTGGDDRILLRGTRMEFDSLVQFRDTGNLVFTWNKLPKYEGYILCYDTDSLIYIDVDESIGDTQIGDVDQYDYWEIMEDKYIIAYQNVGRGMRIDRERMQGYIPEGANVYLKGYYYEDGLLKIEIVDSAQTKETYYLEYYYPKIPATEPELTRYADGTMKISVDPAITKKEGYLVYYYRVAMLDGNTAYYWDFKESKLAKYEVFSPDPFNGALYASGRSVVDTSYSLSRLFDEVGRLGLSDSAKVNIFVEPILSYDTQYGQHRKVGGSTVSTLTTIGDLKALSLPTIQSVQVEHLNPLTGDRMMAPDATLSYYDFRKIPDAGDNALVENITTEWTRIIPEPKGVVPNTTVIGNHERYSAVVTATAKDSYTFDPEDCYLYYGTDDKGNTLRRHASEISPDGKTAIFRLAQTQYWSDCNHNKSSEWTPDSFEHWHECTICNKKLDIAAHTWTNVTIDGMAYRQCSVCGYKTRIGTVSPLSYVYLNQYPFVYGDTIPTTLDGDLTYDAWGDCRIKTVEWYRSTDSTLGTKISAGDRFEEGYSYYAKVTFQLGNIRDAFADSTKLLWFLRIADYGEYREMQAEKFGEKEISADGMTVTQCFAVPFIERATINLTIPQMYAGDLVNDALRALIASYSDTVNNPADPGNMAYIYIYKEVPNGSNQMQGYAMWNNAEKKYVVVFDDGVRFEEGESYYFDITFVEPNHIVDRKTGINIENMQFLDSPDIIFFNKTTSDGCAATPRIKLPFTPKLRTISQVNLTLRPCVGQTLGEFTTALREQIKDEPYTIEFVEVGNSSDPSYIFTSGNKLIYVRIKPKTGYAFINELKDGSKYVAVNGEYTYCWSDMDDTIGIQPTITATNGVTVGGSFKSYKDAVNTTIQLIESGQTEAAYEFAGIGTKPGNAYTGTWLIPGVMAGTYTVKVMKANHVTREYTITVGSTPVTQNVEICLIGDITGDGNVNTSDVGRANAHAKNSSLLTDYAFKCADVTGDGNVNTSDVGRINAHAKGSNPLWK